MEDIFAGCEGWLTGIEALDIQHVELAACINKAAGACCSTKAIGELPGLVDHLYQKTREHFEYEEFVMREAGYPDFTAHRREHIMLLAELKLVLDSEPGSGRVKVDSKMVGELKTWFLAHIKHSDCQFSAYISRHRVASKLNSKL